MKLVISLLPFLVSDVLAASKLYMPISNKDFNRIEVPSGIREIIGDDTKYKIINDTSGKNIYLLPKVPIGVRFSISIISTTGLSQDIEMQVKDVSSQSLVLSVPTSKLLRVKHDHELKKMLKAMARSETGKYYVTTCNRKLKPEGGITGLHVIQNKTYRFGELTGAVLLVKNSTNESKLLKEEDFAILFEGSVAVAITDKLLMPKGSTAVFVITRGVSDDR